MQYPPKFLQDYPFSARSDSLPMVDCDPEKEPAIPHEEILTNTRESPVETCWSKQTICKYGKVSYRNYVKSRFHEVYVKQNLQKNVHLCEVTSFIKNYDIIK